MDDRERRRRGLKVRREVLGDAHVERAREATDDFDAELQDLITRYAWGELWTRPGLPRKLRSLITLAMLAALGRHEELRFHVTAALRNGVTRDELKELLLHAAVYCGVPAAHSAFRVAREALAADAPQPRGLRRARRRG